MVSEPGSSELGSSFRSSTSFLPCHFEAIQAVEVFLSSWLCNLFKMKMCSSMACPEAVLSPSLCLMSVLKKEGHWKHVQAILIHCPRRNLSRRKLSTCILCGDSNMKKGGVFGMVGSRRKVTQRRRCWLPNQLLRSDHT